MFIKIQDELLWGAAWLLRATNEVSYFNFLKSLGASDATDIFSWDNKYAGAYVLLSRVRKIAYVFIKFFFFCLAIVRAHLMGYSKCLM